MTNEAPERIWAYLDGPFVGMFVSGGLTDGGTEYLRSDLARPKVKPLDEGDRAEIINAAHAAMRKAQRGVSGQMITEWDSIESWIIIETERRILSALEGQDDG